MSDKAISTKGLTDFTRKWLLSNEDASDDEYISVSKGQKISPEALEKYQTERTEDFMKRAGSWTEDLLAFIMEQKKLRELSDIETIFGLALTSIQLRYAYGSPQGDEKKLSDKEKEALLNKFDSICWGAQQFFDAHK